MQDSIQLAKSSQFSDLYKVSLQIDQNKRRIELLLAQKRHRENLLDNARGLNQALLSPKNVNPVPEIKKVKEYNHKIMFSEWFIDLPPDLDVSWFMKFCPVGHRNLVVAEKHSTRSYSKSGRFEYKFKSLLPGGLRANEKPKTTILDCIYSDKTKTFYVLDALMWSDQDLTHCDAEFRFFWLQSKFSEEPELGIRSTINTYSFKYISHIFCDYILLQNKFDVHPPFEDNLPSVDGLLFYHKEASYTSGTTPLVGWLKPFMVPEILNLNVAEEYNEDKPIDYINIKQYIENTKHLKKQKRKQKRDANKVQVEMDLG